MGSLFKRKSVQPAVPDELAARCREQPDSYEVFDEVASHLDSKALLAFYRELAADDERHQVGVARAYAQGRLWDLATTQYRKVLKRDPRPEFVEELAQTYEEFGRANEADKVRRSYSSEPDS